VQVNYEDWIIYGTVTGPSGARMTVHGRVMTVHTAFIHDTLSGLPADARSGLRNAAARHPHSMFLLDNGALISVPVEALLAARTPDDGTVEVETEDLLLTLKPDPDR
jgi:hypothetical protein